MKYTSTCGGVSNLTFEQALFSTGFVKDGGLLMPESVPVVSQDTLKEWKDLSYPELCKRIVPLFISEQEIPRNDLNALLDRAFSKFSIAEVVKVARLKDDLNIAELWHGKTLAFKDLALSCVGQFLEYFLKKRKKNVTAIVATSGDTGSAAIESVRGLEWIDIVVLLPQGRITKIQELMMTTVLDDNVHVMAGENSTSDDLDVVVNKLYMDQEFKEHNRLMTINSINWARVMVQVAHFFFSYFQVCESCDQTVDIIVPTGGCGNVTAGCVAKFMGLPIKLVCAVNSNDIVHRIIQNGDYSLTEVVHTWASAMDIQIPYNFQRILWLTSGKDTELVSKLMKQYDDTGKFVIPDDLLKQLQSIFSSYSLDDDGILKIMQKCWHDNEYLLCPHTAVAAGCHYERKSEQSRPSACIATASPVKFPEAVLKAGLTPQTTPQVEALESMQTKYILLREGDDWEKILREKIKSLTSAAQKSKE
ncbi:threonine synthase-like 2 [Ptychodera flava]|uniref:threonine synthase-like 2 n=1 Tax=Ptychodera flava TaxID=63121 RepID=UPI003969E5E1